MRSSLTDRCVYLYQIARVPSRTNDMVDDALHPNTWTNRPGNTLVWCNRRAAFFYGGAESEKNSLKSNKCENKCWRRKENCPTFANGFEGSKNAKLGKVNRVRIWSATHTVKKNAASVNIMSWVLLHVPRGWLQGFQYTALYKFFFDKLLLE